jgi:GxxExxY protein
MIDDKYKYSEITAKVISCAFKVHSTLGNGFQEVIYQRALEIEMDLEGIMFNREFEMPIIYRNRQIGTRRVDFLVEGVVSVELKSIVKLEEVHLAQALNYFGSSPYRVGDFRSISGSLQVKIFNLRYSSRIP